MGNKESTFYSTNQTQQVGQTNHNDDLTEFRILNDPEFRYMLHSLRNDQELFVLNNLMLCVQFFENYDREIQDLRSRSVSPREVDINTILSPIQKHVLLPDALEDQVSRHVMIKSTRLTENCEPTIEPFQPVRTYVVLDNVYVNRFVERPNDSKSTDPISYKFRLESSSNYGHVKLRYPIEPAATTEPLIETLKRSDLLDIAEDDDDEEDRRSKSRMNPEARFPSGVGKCAREMIKKPTYTPSISDQYNLERMNREAKLSGTRSHANLAVPKDLRDEGFQEPSYSETYEWRNMDEPLKQSEQSKAHPQNTQQQQHRPSTNNTPRSTLSSDGYQSGLSGRSSDFSDTRSSMSSCTASTCSMGQADLPVSPLEIPDRCFKTIYCTRNGKVYNKKQRATELQTLLNKRIRRVERGLNEERVYLRSHLFQKYFENLFVNRLAEPLGFNVQDNTDVDRQGAIIHCTKELLGNSALVVRHEIVPSFLSEWPESCSEWLQRSRSAVLDPLKQPTWLTEEMIEKVEQLGCHIIPESYNSPTKHKDPYHTVEWQLNFPAAERYLETCLSHSQAKVYMMALMLHKSFMRFEDSEKPFPKLTKSHIRSQLFWLLEKNYSPSMWSEDRAGEGLKELLNNLHSALSQSESYLPDYFSRSNLFANIKEDLRLPQKQLKRIIENPVLYMITSMQKIRYKPDFFPALDYKRLYKLLTIEDENLLAFIRPDLSSVERPISQAQGNNPSSVPVVSVTENNRENSVNKPENTSQTVDILDECAVLEGLRLIAVLEMFIKHFTEMATRCYNYRAMKQTDIYLDQAQRLSMILWEQTYGKGEARKHLNTIKILRCELSRSCRQENAPGTSAQNDQPSVSIPLNEFLIGKPEVRRVTYLLGSEAGETNEYDIRNGDEQSEL